MKHISFNREWTFEKREKDSQLKSFQGQSDKIKVTLPYDAMIREKRSADCPSGAQSGFYPGGEYIYEKEFFAPEEWMDQDVYLEFEGGLWELRYLVEWSQSEDKPQWICWICDRSKALDDLRAEQCNQGWGR